MSAKITVIVYILICFEVGILLLILPWTPYWEDNFFLYYITNKLNAAWVPTLLTSGYVKGAVTGLGALNILAGLRDIIKFRESVDALAALGNGEIQSESGPESRGESRSAESGPIESRVTEPAPTESRPTKPSPTQTVTLSDHRPPSIPPQP
jgi:hypothetical protein